MCFYLLKRNYGLEPTTIREIFFEKASAQRKDSVEVAWNECPYSIFGLRGGQLPRSLLAIVGRAAGTLHAMNGIPARVAWVNKRAAINIHGALLELVCRRRGGRLFI